MSERDHLGRPLCVTCGYWVATCGYQCEACALDDLPRALERIAALQQTDPPNRETDR